MFRGDFFTSQSLDGFLGPVVEIFDQRKSIKA